MCRGPPSPSSTVRPAAMIDCASTCPPKTRPCGIGWLRPTKMSASESPRSRLVVAGAVDADVGRADGLQVEDVQQVLEGVELGGFLGCGHVRDDIGRLR